MPTSPLLLPSSHYPLLTRRGARREWAKGLVHLGPAVLLVHGAAEAVRRREVSGLHGLEFAVGAVFVALVLRHWFRVRYRADRAAPHGPEWLELAAAGILGLEGYHLHHRHALAPGPHPFHVLPWLYGAVAAGYALLAFHPAWLVHRRGLRFTPDGFWLRRWALGRARRVRWAALRAVVPVGTGPDLLLFVHLGDQPEPLALHQYLNGPVLFDQLLAQAAAHGVALEEPEEYRGKSSQLQRTA